MDVVRRSVARFIERRTQLSQSNFLHAVRMLAVRLQGDGARRSEVAVEIHRLEISPQLSLELTMASRRRFSVTSSTRYSVPTSSVNKMIEINSISKIDDTFHRNTGRVDYMTSNPLSKMFTLLDHADIDSNELIAQEMIDEGLSINPDENTWELNSRIDQHEVEVRRRARRFQHRGSLQHS